MTVSGKVFVLPSEVFDDLNTDIILPGAYLRQPEEELGKYAFYGVLDSFAELVKERSILVGGKNFGCGSSREQAPKALIQCGINMIIAHSYGYIFYRNAINLGLIPLMFRDYELLLKFQTDSLLETDIDSGKMLLDKTEVLYSEPLAPVASRITNSGGLLNLLKQNPRAFE